MGKVSKFFKSLLGFKTTATPPSNKQPKRRWSFVDSHSEQPRHLHSASKSFDGEYSLERHPPCRQHQRHHSSSTERNEALAAATAAVVDTAVAAAKAAAEVTRMASRTAGHGGRRELAAVKIQSCFRAYLARKALRALKALVKVQAVVRGHILRKQTADMMRRLQALIRAQTRARTARSQITDSTTNAYSHSRRNGSKSYTRGITCQERTFFDGPTGGENEKIVEVDTEKPRIMTGFRNLLHSDRDSFGYSHSLTASKGSTVQPTSSSPNASCEGNSMGCSMKWGLATPIKSDGSRSYVSGYSVHPNYMSYTESSRAKVRSLSAPKLRPQNENNATKRDLVYGHQASMRSVSKTRDSLIGKGYRGSGRINRVGIPVVNSDVGLDEAELCGACWN